VKVPGQGLEPRPPRSERGVLPVRRSRSAPRPPSTPDTRGRRSGTVAPVFARAMTRTAGAERCFLCHSPTLRPWIADSGVLRGGALEPGALAVSGKCAGKSRTEFSTELPGTKSAEGPFSLRRGLDCDQGFSSWASSFGLGWLTVGTRCKNDEGDPLGSPSLELVCGKTLARIPPGEGLGVIGPALAAGRRVGAGERRGGGRFGRERLGIDRHQHGWVGVMPNGTLVETSDARKGTFEFIHL
jgi:hypothetical protein